MSGLRRPPMLLPFLLLLLEAAAPALALEEGPPGTEGYYWFKRAGTYVGNGAVPFKVPTDLSKPPAWTWDNPDDELFRHGPVIDDKKNIYAATSCGWIRKFSPDGQALWSLRMSMEEGRMVTSPFLYKGRLFISSMGWPPGQAHIVHCIDMETGERVWSKPGPRGFVNFDSSTVHVAEDVVLGAAMSYQSDPGNNKIWAVNATDGDHLWDFVLDDKSLVWNFMPSTPGDGTFLFASTCAGAERHRLFDGSRIWRGAIKDAGWCGTGGGTLGPDGVFYAFGNHFVSEPLPGMPPCTPESNCPEGWGLMAAYDVEDGKIRWAKRLELGFGGWQYPTVGKIDGVLRIVAGIGMNPAIPEIFMGPKYLPWIVRFQISRWQVRFAWLRRLLEVSVKRNAVAVYNAEKGDLLWMWEEEPWDYYGAAGDEATRFERSLKAQTDPRVEDICGPDNWGIPVIAADGTVIMGSGNTGNLYAIRDGNGDKVIDPSEVSTLKTGNAFLNGPAVAPGMMVAAPCWGKMYVFKD